MSSIRVSWVLGLSLVLFRAPAGAQWHADGQFQLRAAHALAYDETLARLVLVGGTDDMLDPVESAYERVLGAWTLQCFGTTGSHCTLARGEQAGSVPECPFGPIVFHGTVFDESRRVVVLHSQLNGTWELRGAGWVGAPQGPPVPAQFTMVYDQGRGVVTLVNTDRAHDFDGASWTAGAALPVPRQNHAGAYDSRRGVTVLFGGDALNDTWEYDGSAWSAGPAAPPALSPRSFHTMAFHQRAGVTILHGGRLLGDTWSYDGSAWTPVAGAGPSPRYRAAMTYDRSREQVILYGGTEEEGPTCTRGDIWAFGCANVISPPTLPDARCGDPYPTRQLSVTGGVPPYVFSVSHGSLPPGLILTPQGQVQGTPTRPGFHRFDVAAEDAAGCSSGWPYQIFVSGVATEAELLPPALPRGVEGMPYVATFSVSGGFPPYTFAVVTGALPPGIALDPATGDLSGTPSREGVWPFGVEAVSPACSLAARDYVLQIQPSIDVAVGAGFGPASPNRVKLVGADGVPTSVDFLAYQAGAWGAHVATGHVAPGPFEAFLTGPGPGPMFGPQVRAFDRHGVPDAKVNFYAYGTLRYGVGVDGADLDGDGLEELLTAPGPGSVFGPHVRGFDVDAIAVRPLPGVSFFAYQTLAYGANARGGDVDVDAASEIVTGPGPGQPFGAQVRAFAVAPVTPIPGLSFLAFSQPGYGVRVAVDDVDGDGRADAVATPGPGPSTSHPARFRGFVLDAPVAELPAYDVTPFVTLYGGRVGLADLDADGGAELLAAPGPDPSAIGELRLVAYDGILHPLGGFVVLTTSYGANVDGGAFGRP